jgi:Na+-transporting methylmalonyl-CoA/oxaloacetate decarboxylase gamma subunit
MMNEFPLTNEGIVFMILGWGFVFGLLSFSLIKILSSNKKEKN